MTTCNQTCAPTQTLEWQAGNDESHILRTSSQDTGEPVNLTRGDMTIRTTVDSPNVVATTVGVVTEGNTITFSFTPEETELLTPNNKQVYYFYETKVVFASGEVKTLTQGRLKVLPTIVREDV